MNSRVGKSFDPLTQFHSMRRLFPDRVRKCCAEKINSLHKKGLVDVTTVDMGGTWSGGLRKLPWDSSFFQIGIGRIEFLGTERVEFDLEKDLVEAMSFIRHLKKTASSLEIDYLSVQVDTSDVLQLASLQAEGFIIVDTIVCYLLDLKNIVPSENSLVREALITENESVAEIARVCFRSPSFNSNRFNSDPLFSVDQIGTMYSIWGLKSVSGEMADKVLVYDDGNGPSGFITINLPDSFDTIAGLNLGSIPLNAVVPHRHGMGIYSALVQGALLELKRNSIDWVDIRTQLPNTAVHKTWQKLGANPVLSYHTLRHYAQIPATK